MLVATTNPRTVKKQDLAFMIHAKAVRCIVLVAKWNRPSSTHQDEVIQATVELFSGSNVHFRIDQPRFWFILIWLCLQGINPFLWAIAIVLAGYVT